MTAILIVLLILLPVGNVLAAAWIFSPSVSVSEAYHSNITLSSTEKKQQIVSRITPKILLSATGRRLQLKSNYSMGYINYWGDEFRDRYSQRGSLSSNLELIRDHLFIGASASVSEQVIDPAATPVNDVIAVTSNRTEARSIRVTPMLRNRFGRFANSRLTTNFSYLSQSSAQVSSSYRSSLNYRLSSGSWFNQLSWSGNASYRRGKQRNLDNYNLNGRMNYRLLKQWSIFTTAQMNKSFYRNNIQKAGVNYYISVGGGVTWKPSRKFLFEIGGGGIVNSDLFIEKNEIEIERGTWRAKVILTPMNRTSFELGREQARFGSRVYSKFTHYTRKTTWSAVYSERLTSPSDLRNRSLATEIVDDESVVELERAATNDVILRRRLDMSGTVRRKKVNIKGRGFYEKGEYQTSEEIDKRYGGNLGLTISLTRKLRANATSTYQRYYFNSQSRVDDIYSFRSGLTRQMGKRSSAKIAYNWQNRRDNTRFINYSTHQIVATFRIAL